jgi:hypothetical protein
VRWRRFPNQNGGSAAVHPSDTPRFLEGIRFEDGRYAAVIYVEREAHVDVLHFNFVEQAETLARPA